MGNELSTLTTDDLQVQLDQLQKTEAEEKARELFKQETSVDFSYQSLIDDGLTGFTHAYVAINADFKTMTTTAKQDVVLSLAKSDLSRDLTFSKFLFSDSKASVYKVNELLIVCLS